MSNNTGYTFGQCTFGAAMLETWIPPGLGNADTWIPRALGKNLRVSQAPIVGSAMVFSSSYPGSHGDGHVGVVAGFGKNGYPIIVEMNANRQGGGPGVYDVYQTTPYDLSFVEGYLLPASGNPNPVTATQIEQTQMQISQSKTGLFNLSSLAGLTGASPAFSGLVSAGYDLNPIDQIGGVWSQVLNVALKAGEVVIGLVVLLVGVYFIAKEGGGGTVVNVIGKVPGVAGAVSKVGGMA